MYNKFNKYNYKNKKIRKYLKNKEIKRLVFKTLCLNINNNKLDFNKEELLDELFDNFNNLMKNINFSKIRNRCIVTGRSRSVFRKFKLCRSQLRKLFLTEYSNYKKL